MELKAMKIALPVFDENIKVFEAAIQKEIQTQIGYKQIIRDLENPPVRKPGDPRPIKYDIEAMKKAVSQCDINIKIFENAIQKEQNTKLEYKRIIRELEFQEANPPKIIIESPKVNIQKDDKDDNED